MALGNDWTNIASRSVYVAPATITFYIDVKLNRQDISGNYSVVDTRLRSTISGSAAGSGYRFTLTGSNGTSGDAVWYFANETILTGQTTIYHNDDGTKVGSANAYCYNRYLGISVDFSGSFELPTIARASTPTISPSSTFNIGDTITIKTNRKSSNFTHTLSLTFGTYSYQIGTNIGESIILDTSTIASDLYQQTTTEASKNGTITCITYNGSTQIGTKNITFTAKVVNSNPTFTETYQDINPTTTAITLDSSKLIRNNSNLQISITNAEAKNYATLSSLTAVIEGVTYTGSLRGTGGSIDVGTLNISSNVVAQVILTDSRGIATIKNVNLTILDWQLPSGIINLQRQNNFYSETDINVDADYSSLDGNNTIEIKVRDKKVGTSTWSAYTTLQDNVTSTLTLDNNYQWDVQVLLTDRLGSTTYNLTIDRGIPILYIDRIKRSLGIDCFPQNDSNLEINGSTIFDLIYPVGSIYLSVNNVNPSTIFGGTWVQVSEGRALFGAGSITNTYSINGTSTDFTNSYTADTNVNAGLPNINGKGHYADNNNEFEGALYNVKNGNYIADGSATGTLIGLDASKHNTIYGSSTIVQPNAYVIYVWKRTA